jgi:hypothetical protein
MAGVPGLELFVHMRRFAPPRSLRWRDGAPATQPLARRHLPRLDAWRLPHVDLPRRRRPADVHAPPRRDGEAPQLAGPLLLPDGHSLPPSRRMHAGRPLRRLPLAERRLRAEVQRAPRSPRPPLRRPLRLHADRVGGATRRHHRVRPVQPGHRRPLRGGFGLAVERRLDGLRPAARRLAGTRAAERPQGARGQARSRRSSRRRRPGCSRSAWQR